MCITLVFVTGKMVAAQLSSIISWLVCEQIMTMDVMWKGEKKEVEIYFHKMHKLHCDMINIFHFR